MRAAVTGAPCSEGRNWRQPTIGWPPVPTRIPGPTTLQQEYLLAARQAASRRQRTLVGGSTTVAIVAVALLIFALISRGQAVNAETNARSQDLAAESGTQQSVDAERAVLLAAAAVRTKVSYGPNGTMFALRAAIDASTIRYRLPNAGTQGCGGPGVAYDPAPHSDLLAEALCSGEIKFANATTGRIERTARSTSRRRRFCCSTPPAARRSLTPPACICASSIP